MADTREKTLYGRVSVVADPKTVLEERNESYNKRVLIIETDSGRIKVGDGLGTPYRALPYLTEKSVPPELVAYLENANNVGGVPLIDKNGKIPESTLPDDLVRDDNMFFFQTGNAQDAQDFYEKYINLDTTT